MSYPAAYPEVIAVGAASIDGGKLERIKDAPGLTADREENKLSQWTSKFNAHAGSPVDELVDVVAKGLRIKTTDLVANHESPPFTWDRFLGTSAAGPIVAGLAARILRDTDLDADGVRNRIRCLAWMPDIPKSAGSLDVGYVKNYWVEFGFGWISRRLKSILCGDDAQSQPPPDDGQGGGQVPNADCPPKCGGLPTDRDHYKGKFKECARPLSAFLHALSERSCCELLYDYMDDPYLTAYTAGVPYSAAVWLGSGNWDAIDLALQAENNRAQQTVQSIVDRLGPIWVKSL